MVDLAQVRELESVLIAAWPAAEQVVVDGWAYQANDGFTGRANSVAVLGPCTEPVAVAVDRAEAWYLGRGLTPMVRVTPLSGTELVGELKRRRYEPRPSPSQVMVRPLTVPQTASSVATVTASPNEAWWGLSGRSAEGRRAWADMADRLGEQTVFASVEVDGEVAAIGQGVLAAEHVSFFAMATHANYRRRGLAGRLIEEIERWGQELGAHTATLQVETNNVAARRLYEARGYQNAYEYRYLRAPSRSCVD